MSDPNPFANDPNAAPKDPSAQDPNAENKPADDGHEDDEIRYFDTTVTKLVKRENEDGDEEWIEVMSDNLYPGERLKRDVEEEKAKEKADKAKSDAEDAKKDADKDKG